MNRGDSRESGDSSDSCESAWRAIKIRVSVANDSRESIRANRVRIARATKVPTKGLFKENAPSIFLIWMGPFARTLFSRTLPLTSSLLFRGNSTCKILEHLVWSNTSGFQFWGPLARTNFLSALCGLPKILWSHKWWPACLIFRGSEFWIALPLHLLFLLTGIRVQSPLPVVCVITFINPPDGKLRMTWPLPLPVLFPPN